MALLLVVLLRHGKTRRRERAAGTCGMRQRLTCPMLQKLGKRRRESLHRPNMTPWMNQLHVSAGFKSCMYLRARMGAYMHVHAMRARMDADFFSMHDTGRCTEF